MRKVVLSMFITVDGYVAGPDNRLDFFEVFAGDKTIAEDAAVFLHSIDTILLGGRAYEEFIQYWPTASSEEVITDQMNEIPKIIFSRTRQEVSWGKWDNARLVKEGRELIKIKQSSTGLGKDMVLFGGVDIAHSFLNLGLVDEYRLLIAPVLLGKGKRLFEGGRQVQNLKLTDTKTYESGVVRCNYRS